jgi:hypothetical protein
LLSGNARADDDCDKQTGSEEFGEQSPRQDR